MADMELDETSCGPLCQHPQCWASNRRVERGLPRLEVTTASKDKAISFEYEGLPTMKVQNILDDYGFSGTDAFPTVYQVASLGTADLSMVHSRQRSASAPSTTVGKSMITVRSSKSPRARGGQSRRERSRPPLLEPIQQSYPPKLSKVHLNHICGPITPSDEVRMGSPVYLWRPSEKSLRSIDTPVNKTDSRPVIIAPKDMTEELIPASIADQDPSRKKMKSKRSKQTPTGGRPYTHPLKSPSPIARRTLPADIDDGIAQLLSLPRDVILQILEHTKESDLFDKEKVQALLARVMPHVRFDGSQGLTPGLGSPSPSLHAMGLLRNQKMPILEGKQKFEKSEAPLKSIPRIPLVLDRSEVTRTYKGGGDEGTKVHEHPRITGGMPDVSHPLRSKITSVSAKSLPPLLPGTQVTKPFHYTIQSLDLALTPLTTPENPPSSPRSENASTLYVTLPSEPSDDHSLLSTAKHPHLAVMRQESPASSHHSHGSPNQMPSYSTYQGPYNASGPYGSPGPFNTPHGTPVSYSIPGPIPTSREGQSIRTGSGSTIGRGTLQTIHECAASTPDTLVAAASPSMKQPRSVSPWEAQEGHPSRTLSTPTNPSPEVWPVVDEKSYLHSPENAEPEKTDKDIPETIAPPPSPAPSVRSGMLDEDGVNTEGAIIQKVMDCNQGSDEAITTDGSRDDTEKRALSAIEEDDSKALQKRETYLVESGDSIIEAHVTQERDDKSDTAVMEGGKTHIRIEDNKGTSLADGQNRSLTDLQETGSSKVIMGGEINLVKIEGSSKYVDNDDTQEGELSGLHENQNSTENLQDRLILSRTEGDIGVTSDDTHGRQLQEDQESEGLSSNNASEGGAIPVLPKAKGTKMEGGSELSNTTKDDEATPEK